MKIIFSGTPEFAIPALKALLNSKHEICAVYTQPDRPAGRGQKLTPSPVKKFAQENNLPIFQPASLKTPETQVEFKAHSADVLVNVAYGLILPKVILEATKFGCVNIHPSLLPRWRGAAPIQRAILAGDQETGVSIMQMDEGLDTGGIYQQVKLPITINDTSASLMEKTAILGAELLLQVLSEIENGAAKVIPQNDASTTYAKKLTKEEAKINWSLSAEEIDRIIRAFIPWPIAYTEIADQIVRVWQAVTVNKATSQLPGTIIAANKEGIEVATGKNVLILQKLQLAGGKTLAVKEILNAHFSMFSAGKQFKCA